MEMDRINKELVSTKEKFYVQKKKDRQRMQLEN